MKHISVEELKQRIENNEQVHLLDVREHSERTEFNIGGHHIPLGNVQSFMLDPIEHLKDEPIVIYCRSGKRSQMAGMMLEQAGYTNVYNLTGGMLDWQEKHKQ